MEAAMFQKIATLRDPGARRAMSGPVVLTHANDNRINARGIVAPTWARRPILARHWRPTAGGRLECYWHIETAGASAEQEPDGRWTMRRVCA
jgi:hypothetical protein